MIRPDPDNRPSAAGDLVSHQYRLGEVGIVIKLRAWNANPSKIANVADVFWPDGSMRTHGKNWLDLLPDPEAM